MKTLGFYVLWITLLGLGQMLGLAQSCPQGPVVYVCGTCSGQTYCGTGDPGTGWALL
jgi:hypothetical protein